MLESGASISSQPGRGREGSYLGAADLSVKGNEDVPPTETQTGASRYVGLDKAPKCVTGTITGDGNLRPACAPTFELLGASNHKFNDMAVTWRPGARSVNDEHVTSTRTIGHPIKKGFVRGTHRGEIVSVMVVIFGNTFECRYPDSVIGE
ncbi:hypothetical protein LX32DRAFT_351620 [Colletotrichum zoysiae]|uniref:Uncharacterized protein n=1 Tax=Colletotrichum zoysiae TaxID=1216348 RepID=A0AAD9HIC5_9PEZI|nr:hypothetical protein LX32DRAFT_351620 [Colletotrichum zoysiae]